jgi:hypothetical protein
MILPPLVANIMKELPTANWTRSRLVAVSSRLPLASFTVNLMMPRKSDFQRNAFGVISDVEQKFYSIRCAAALFLFNTVQVVT